jgi:hypothetical protein
VVISTDPITAMPVSENTLSLQTIPTVMVWITVPEPRMEFHPDQQQAYQEKQQARAHAEQIDTELWATQHHDELAGKQATLNAKLCELH